MPDLRQPAEVLRRQLRLFQVNVAVNFRGMLQANPDAFIDLYRYLLCNHSLEVTSFLVENQFQMNGTDNYKFMGTVYRVCRDVLDMKPAVSLSQFFTQGFPEKKLQMAADIIKALGILQKDLHRQMISKTPTTSLYLSRSSSARAGAVRKLMRSYSPNRSSCSVRKTNSSLLPISENNSIQDSSSHVRFVSSPIVLPPPIQTFELNQMGKFVESKTKHPLDRQKLAIDPNVFLKPPANVITSGISILTDNETDRSNTPEISQQGDSQQTQPLLFTPWKKNLDENCRGERNRQIDADDGLEKKFPPTQKAIYSESNPCGLQNMINTIAHQVNSLVARISQIESRVTIIEKKQQFNCKFTISGDKDDAQPKHQTSPAPLRQSYTLHNQQNFCSFPGDIPLTENAPNYDIGMQSVQNIKPNGPLKSISTIENDKVDSVPTSSIDVGTYPRFLNCDRNAVLQSNEFIHPTNHAAFYSSIVRQTFANQHLSETHDQLNSQSDEDMSKNISIKTPVLSPRRARLTLQDNILKNSRLIDEFSSQLTDDDHFPTSNTLRRPISGHLCQSNSNSEKPSISNAVNRTCNQIARGKENQFNTDSMHLNEQVKRISSMLAETHQLLNRPVYENRLQK